MCGLWNEKKNRMSGYLVGAMQILASNRWILATSQLP